MASIIPAKKVNNIANVIYSILLPAFFYIQKTTEDTLCRQ